MWKFAGFGRAEAKRSEVKLGRDEDEVKYLKNTRQAISTNLSQMFQLAFFQCDVIAIAGVCHYGKYFKT
jgi:hypothetical protein